ncbi:MAG: phospholipid carrier-dependent glycosyltransferase, partial [Cyanobacteria bacterium J06559_3]
VLVTVLNLFPIGLAPGAWIASTLAPESQLYPYRGQPYPHPELMDWLAQVRPYQIATLGGLHSTAAVNQFNISYYGKLQDYQVYGRQVAERADLLEQDLRSLSWFYARRKLDQPWPPEHDSNKAEMVRQLEQRPEFEVDQTWDLPGNRRLYLYRRQTFPVTVTALPDSACAASPVPQLSRVETTAQVPPGQPMPVTYEWVGQWQALRTGIVLLTWQPDAPTSPNPTANRPWIHDHSIGLGTLRPNPIQPNQTTLSAAKDINPDGCFQITERTATLPPADLAPGSYRLTGRYLNGQDSSPQSLEISEVTVTLATDAPPVEAPELDWVTQLREVSRFLPQGPNFLDNVFGPVGRINLYDPIQNYTVQAEQTLTQRWQDEPEIMDYGYGLALSQVLQLKVPEAIATLEQLARQDANNPYAHAYLGFAHLYAFHPKATQTALAPALELAPDSPEIQGLSALAALLQGHVREAWQRFNTAIDLAVNEA